MVETEIFKRENNSFILVNSDVIGNVTTDWFTPEYWGDKASLVGSGGRGGAWFIKAGDKEFVLREYLRGGLASHISRKTYAYTGEHNVRSFSEFRVLNRMISMDLPVPVPVAAWYRKVSPIQYRAAIIIERIKGATPLADLIGKLDSGDWHALGQTVRRFHDADVRHADLNCFNVLMVEKDFFLIDFDKGCIMPPSSRSNWKADNLNRLARSLKKVAGDAALNRFWNVFLNGYEGSSAA
ncbi:3-deoxy-D-manno-octulosonic acid kinase [Marinobacter xiaoshiensis]|uniref:3-deoxy-D-manno-octulosonic acid kinase n=1 Tax=Marinobacter xiaoshiensis TaxID=3073652 RepID=A0ABU2HHU4_9GAMM|nr:3-deoxy-D-manno-octulosonic acid kinase [Marinobacter sp. F60267]MDS1310642.1 3-deoxy-D-manno-octulosonic acid kinase [Marinobacter sp. F60267]